MKKIKVADETGSFFPTLKEKYRCVAHASHPPMVAFKP